MRVRQFVEELSHLTWSGRLSWAYYAIRQRFVTPAPEGDRCIMGYPVGAHLRCPRRSDRGGLWCARHARSA